jgi:cobalt-zinc-cadmium resistance protein CzcA
MALATSAGAEVQKPLATVVIGGLVTSTLLTLVVIPCLYIYFERGIRPHPSTSSPEEEGVTPDVNLPVNP